MAVHRMAKRSVLLRRRTSVITAKKITAVMRKTTLCPCCCMDGFRVSYRAPDTVRPGEDEIDISRLDAEI